MNITECKGRIKKFLEKNDVESPLIVDVQNQNDLKELIREFCVKSGSHVSAAHYCKEDEYPRIENIINDIQNRECDYFFLTGLTSFLRLVGEHELTDVLRAIVSLTTTSHVVIISYQCKRFLNFGDPRISRRILILDGDIAKIPHIYFVSPKLPIPQEVMSKKGIEKLADVIEYEENDDIYLVTRIEKNTFQNALYNITEIQSAYDILCLKDIKTRELNKEMGTEKQWQYALSLFDSSWDDLIDAEFGDHRKLDIYIAGLSYKSDEYRWLYYIGIKLYGAKGNWCLNDAAIHSNSLEEMKRNIYIGILSRSHKENDFWECYTSRKEIICQMEDHSAEIVSFRNLARAKGQDEIYYLTDVTQCEKEEIFYVLDRYGAQIGRAKLVDILAKIYPDLCSYLRPYEYKDKLLTEYFDEYNYQKVINKLFPEFYEKVLDQAEKRDYNALLPPRSSKIEEISKENALLYFVDAMGVEYLSYIKSLCNNLKLHVDITVCRCELPSITSVNKEFLNGWSPEQIISIKDIDDIKHHGKDDFDYYRKSKLPIHLIKELEIIKGILKNIQEKLRNGRDEAVIISDHGASRLVVLYDHENIWEMGNNGEHSGRCCKKNVVDKQPAYAVDAGDFWSLANYDRFKHGRKANVEAHGGATLEEVCVPIIRIRSTDKIIEAYIMSAESDSLGDIHEVPEIRVSYRKKAEIKLYLTVECRDVSIVINEKNYKAIPLGNGYYSVKMPDLKKKGQYYVDIFSGDNKIANHLPLLIKREGQQENDLL